MTMCATHAPARSTTTLACPGCGSNRTVWADSADQRNMLCKTCGACWHPAADHTERVDPRQCPGCGLSRICRAACC